MRRRQGQALRRVRAVTERRPADVEARLVLAELELVAGAADRAIAEAGMAIQLAPDDGRGLRLLLQADALARSRGDRGTRRGADHQRADTIADYNLL